MRDGSVMADSDLVDFLSGPMHSQPFTFCSDKYAETRQKLFDLTFATFTIAKKKLVEVVLNSLSDFVY